MATPGRVFGVRREFWTPAARTVAFTRWGASLRGHESAFGGTPGGELQVGKVAVVVPSRRQGGRAAGRQGGRAGRGEARGRGSEVVRSEL
ncbi:hypothetical protein QD712_24540 [Streptomyces acidiscabies]|uniref:hypothetical protein n=1 Tax=Streptomyces acidiscabies TaxID=42234 RepID=UPI0030D4C97B